MKLDLLIAEQRDVLRAGLAAIFRADERIACIQEATSREQLQTQLHTHSFDIIVANQELIADVANLSQEKLVLLADSFDLQSFQLAYKHGFCGYFLNGAPAELLRATLCLPKGSILIDPALVAAIIKHLSLNPKLAVKDELLTSREKEIIELLRNGIDRHTITQRLHISEATLKTHIKNISRKRNLHSSASIFMPGRSWVAIE